MLTVRTPKRIFRNVARGWGIPEFKPSFHDSYTIRAYKLSDFSAVKRLYTEAEREEMPLFNRLSLMLCSGRLCAVATSPNGVIVGFDQFYFNERDIKDSTVHEAFITVTAHHSGRGLASALRRHSADHFRKAGLAGISTRISHENAASMASARRCGFKIVEEYIDLDSGKQRAYLIVDIRTLKPGI